MSFKTSLDGDILLIETGGASCFPSLSQINRMRHSNCHTTRNYTNRDGRVRVLAEEKGEIGCAIVQTSQNCLITPNTSMSKTGHTIITNDTSMPLDSEP